MKQLLSGNDWTVSHFLPSEAEAPMGIIYQITKGYLYGGEFIPAKVPGDVQSDALDAGLIEDINYGFNARNAEWTYQRDWIYVKRFVPEDHDCKKKMLCFEGVDDSCQVFLNGQWLGNHETAWIPFEFEITDKLIPNAENTLIVLVKAAKYNEGQFGYAAKVRHLKARFAYGWDWCTRLVPLGIWKDVYISYEQNVSIVDLFAHADVDHISKKAKITAEASVKGEIEKANIRFSLKHPNGTVESTYGNILNNTINANFDISDAKLWYPNGMGEHPLYEVTAEIEEYSEKRSVNIGLRHIEWKQTDGASDDAIPYQPYINGRRVYLQGYNFTPIRQLYGRVHKKAYEKRIEYIKRANANYLRIWGGGLLEREELYDLCDRNGILIMQELFQSSGGCNNHPPRDEEYIEMMVNATRSAVIQKRNHPSLICWCGGNELCFRGKYMDRDGNILIEGAENMEGLTYNLEGYWWVPLGEEYPTLKAMQKVVKELHPGCKWLHTSGSGPVTQNASLSFVGGKMHDVHGPWRVLGPTEQYTLYNELDMMIHHEFGTQGGASVETIEAITPKKYLWPLDAQNKMINYHGRMYSYVYNTLCEYFGKDNITDHRIYSLTSRFLQWEQLRYSLEAHHRLDKKCAGSCIWHLGEPWPNLIENCTIDAYDQVKPAFYGQKAAFSPLHLSAHYSSLIHKDDFHVEFALHNTTENDFEGRIIAEVFDIRGNKTAEFTSVCCAEKDSVTHTAAEYTFNKHELPDGVFFLRYTLYDFHGKALETGYNIHSTMDIPYEQLLTQQECELIVELNDNDIIIRNCGNTVASGVTLECENKENVMFSDGCMLILPGEVKTVKAEFQQGRKPTLMISGFGVPYRRLSL
ncbi:MAG: hypothetical protein E7665_05225 [Ruminococcaceae bacterium]|nr:hypothetical protein [Oscillospiraceae bacterium]